MKISRCATIAVVLLASGVWRLNAQTTVDLTRQGKLASGATIPSQCAVGQLYVQNDPANNFHQLYVCSNTNVWTMASVQSGQGSGRPANCIVGQTWLATDTGAMTFCAATGSPGKWSSTLAGPAGQQGPQGPAGTNGASGSNGSTIWNGTAAPTAATGANGDFYVINPGTAPCLYGPKSSGNWPGTCVSLVGSAGAAGASGNTVLSGTGTPSNSSGGNGDFYIRLDTSSLYGPKAAGVWPGTWTSLIGPQGATGPTGATGPQGPAGSLGGALCTVALSATPAFDASQCNAFSLPLGSTVVTGSTLINAKAGQSLTFTIIQDATGGRSFTWPGNVLAACQVDPAASASTVVTAIFDGANANAITCSTNDSATLIAGPMRTDPSTPTSGLTCWFASTGTNFKCKDPIGNVYAATKTVTAAAANQYVSYIDANGVQNTAPLDANAVKNAVYCPDTSGSANTIICASTTTFPGAYAAGQTVVVKVANTVTGATTININGLGTKTVTNQSGAAIASGNLQSGGAYPMTYDGTNFQASFSTSGSGLSAPSGNGPMKYVGSNNTGQSSGHDNAAIMECLDSSGSGTAQSCSTSPAFTPAAGDTIVYMTTTTNTGDMTVNVNSSSAIHVRKWQKASVLASGDLVAGVYVGLTYDGAYWEIGGNIGNAPSGGGGVSNTTVSVSSGTQGANSCSSGTTVTMTGLTTSMPLLEGYSSDPTAITGWGSSGGMVFQAWVSAANTATWKVCNQTSASVSYGAITFNVGAGNGSTIANTTVPVTGAIQGANSCSSGTTVSMPGLATSSVIQPGYSGDPSGITGWGSTGGMVFDVWPSAANTASWKVCNQTAASITFGAITFNMGAK